MTLKDLDPQLLALSDDEKLKSFNSYPKAKSSWGAVLKKRPMFVVAVPVLLEPASPFGDL
jgi:hypothetical protein